jgi:hypothetical protein
MSFGPIELLVLRFPGNEFRGEIAPALAELVDAGIIRVIDIVFMIKDEGELSVLEINDLDEETYAVWDPIVADITGLLSEDDVQHLSGVLEDNSSAAIMLFENTWATRFVDAVLRANGELVLNERIPRRVIEEVLAAAPLESSAAAG